MCLVENARTDKEELEYESQSETTLGRLGGPERISHLPHGGVCVVRRRQQGRDGGPTDPRTGTGGPQESLGPRRHHRRGIQAEGTGRSGIKSEGSVTETTLEMSLP